MRRQSVDGVFQGLAGTELRHLGLLDLDRFARARVAARASGARRNGERAEAHQRDRTALLERGLDSTDQGVKRTAGSSLGNISLAGDMIDEFEIGRAHV